MLLSDTAHVRPKAFSNIRIQDLNTFLCAENAMNVQARESVCHGKNRIVNQKYSNINILSVSMRNFVTPTIESVRTPARITPYPTGRLFGVALSQALRARSPSQTTAHPKPCTCATNRCDRDVGLAESGYDRTVPPGHFATAFSSSVPPQAESRYVSSIARCI